ncbi:hydrogenase [Clostridia bacterium]|nr:hydrogenase [Clostridia bacterium]
MPSFYESQKSNCKNCYKCIRHCPVKAIRFSGERATLDDENCVLCGKCFVICPQNVRKIISTREQIITLFGERVPVYATVAPSFIANFGGAGIRQLEDGLKKLGFAGAEETAKGAAAVKDEYERILKEEDPDVLISTCCNSVNLLVQKYYPSLVKYLAPVLSPMQANGADIKKRNPKAKVVFIGPCISKMEEAARYEGFVDAVMTFAEITEWFAEKKIFLSNESDTKQNSRARFFPTTGGIIKTMTEKTPKYKYMAVDGLENCISVLNDLSQGMVKKCFIEMSACIGSCVGGPACTSKSIFTGFHSVENYTGEKAFDVNYDFLTHSKTFDLPSKSSELYSEKDIEEILRCIGKTSPQDMLNCGTCGYETCRDKAIAVLQGKADLTMCLPFLKEKAEKTNSLVLQNSPNGIIVLNSEMEVQQINRAALDILRLHSENDILGDKIVRVLNPVPFICTRDEKRNIYGQKVQLTEYDKFVYQTIVYDSVYNMLICIMQDITEQENLREKQKNAREQTLETTDEVIKKQMRIVQEIASLLGETTAETKIALTKLQEVVRNE